jgi:hypothetical protein
MPHEVIHWSLQAKPLRTHVLRGRAKAESDRFIWAITESYIQVYFTQLLKQVELGLKARIARFFRWVHGVHWWSQLPSSVQRAADRRRTWSVKELGSRRVPRSQDLTWLSFGDILKVLEMLSPGDFQACLTAETRRRRQVVQSLSKVKAFRDNQVAHPKPSLVSTGQIASLCRSIENLPSILLPQEWSRVSDLLHTISQLPRPDQEDLHSLSHSFSGRSSINLNHWLACPSIARPGTCECKTHLGRRRIEWRRQILEWCAAYDSGGYTYFGRSYE